jgi:hypothetical protein
MRKMIKLAVVIGVTAMAVLAAPRKIQAVGCIYSPCIDHIYGICCEEICHYYSC